MFMPMTFIEVNWQCCSVKIAFCNKWRSDFFTKGVDKCLGVNLRLKLSDSFFDFEIFLEVSLRSASYDCIDWN